jgi:hypothetical protein
VVKNRKNTELTALQYRLCLQIHKNVSMMEIQQEEEKVFKGNLAHGLWLFAQ